MKKLGLCLLLGVCASAFSADSAFAIKPFSDAFVVRYKVAEPSTDTEKALAAGVATAKCNLCHVDGENKKVRNEYGEQLSKLLDKTNYSVKRRKAEPDVVEAEIVAALLKVEAEMSKSGEAFGDKIKAGKLPAEE
ncbi:MAG: hypothetical protein WDZ51_18535 [Pirellulaceae bacterium]